MKSKVLAALAVCTSMAFSAANARDTVKFGMVLPLTGQTAAYGKDGKAAADMAAKEINDAGGILGGRKIELIYDDEKGTPQEGVAAVQKLMTQAKVHGIIAGMNSSVTLAESAMTKNKIVHINPGAQADAITAQGSPYLFQVNNTTTANATVFHSYLLKNLGAKTMVYMGENTEFSKALLANLQEMIKGTDVKLLDIASYDVNTTDFTSIITKLKSHNPDLLYLVDAAPARTAQIWKQIRQTGGFPTEAHSAGTVFASSIIASEGAMEGVISGDIFITDGAEGKMGEWIAKARTETQSEPNKVTMVVYEAVHILAAAMDKAGTSDDPKKISETLRAEGWETPRGTIRFNEMGRAVAPYFYIQEVKGEGVTLREAFQVN